jgi:hypothetical protein
MAAVLWPLYIAHIRTYIQPKEEKRDKRRVIQGNPSPREQFANGLGLYGKNIEHRKEQRVDHRDVISMFGRKGQILT